MRCPKCQHEQSRKVGGGLCQKCHHNFIFKDPKAGFKFSDIKFGKFLDKLSANGTQYYTTGQAQAAIGFRNKEKGVVIGLTIFMALWSSGFCGGFTFALTGWKGMFFIAPLVAIGVGIYNYLQPQQWPSKDEVHSWLKAYDQRIKKLPHWIQSPNLERDINFEKSDLTSYGAEGVLIVDEDELVDSLVLNHWHTENKMFVISHKGYPSQVLPLVQKSLNEKSDFPVYLFHGTQHPDFKNMIIRSSDFPVANHPINDLGLTRDAIDQSKALKKRFGGHKEREIAGDQIPIAAFGGMVTAMIVGGIVIDDLFSEEKRQQFEASLSSDFG